MADADFRAGWPKNARFIDLEPSSESFLDAVLAGLAQDQKTLPCKFFYDARGSRLFEQICQLEEYYPTRTEKALLKEIAPELNDLVPDGAELVEFGSGSSEKVRILFENMSHFSGYVSIEISSSALEDAASQLAREYPMLQVLAVCADYTQPLELDDDYGGDADDAGIRVGFFPGSTIGNLSHDEAVAFLRNAAGILGSGAGFIIGADLRKDAAILEPAYNDESGVTAAFNLNLLGRINRELGANIDVDSFRHEAIFNNKASRIEMHLVSRIQQSIEIGGQSFDFDAGETIQTENSHKYTLEEFNRVARDAGLEPVRTWTDADDLFSIHFLHIP